AVRGARAPRPVVPVAGPAGGAPGPEPAQGGDPADAGAGGCRADPLAVRGAEPEGRRRRAAEGADRRIPPARVAVPPAPRRRGGRAPARGRDERAARAAPGAAR